VTRQAVVLAGGLATRLGSRTESCPKYLVEVAGRPFAFWHLELLRSSGFEEVLLCIGHLGERIRSEVGDGANLGLAVRYAEDGESALGTGGALRAAFDRLAPTFVVTYGDSYLPFDYSGPLADLEAHPEASATLAVYRNENRFDRSNVRLSGDRVVVYDKHSGGFDHIDYGAMALRKDAVAELPRGPSDLDVFQGALAARGVMRAFLVSERFYEIGSERGLSDLEVHLRTA
jgi:N-acetyl-alpha-D-muramate 1-phosphate uridylyltransferase